VTLVNKVKEGRPHIVDMIKSDKINLIINTTEGRQAISDSSAIRYSAEQHRVYYTTTMAGGDAVCQALNFDGETTVRRIQTLHEELA
jgi:carbamoyl-phosphate synthase large subunit